MLTVSSIATVAVGLHYMQQTIRTENCMRARDLYEKSDFH